MERTQWPSKQFEREFIRLKSAIDLAVISAKAHTDGAAAVQKLADMRGLSPRQFLGADEQRKRSAAHGAANLAVVKAREALRQLINQERQRFFEHHEEMYSRLHTQLVGQLSRAHDLAVELRSLLESLLGEKDLCDEDDAVSEWNELAGRLNRSIPKMNSNAIPGVTTIQSGDTLRARVLQLIFGDAAVREVCSEILKREERAREAKAARKEFYKKVNANPLDAEPPFANL